MGEEALHGSEERLRYIVEEATDYAILTTNAEGIIESWTLGATAVFGWTAEEAVGQPLAMAFTPEDRDAGVPGEELAADVILKPSISMTSWPRWLPAYRREQPGPCSLPCHRSRRG